MQHAVHHAVSRRPPIELNNGCDSSQSNRKSTAVPPISALMRMGARSAALIDTEVRLRAADAVDFSLQQRFRRPLRREDREANARGTAIDGQ